MKTSFSNSLSELNQAVNHATPTPFSKRGLMKILIAFLLTVCCLSAAAQAGAVQSQAAKAEVFSSSSIHAQTDALAQEARAKGSSGATLADYGSHAIRISERTASGGAEIHAHFDDVMMVLEGSATLITGGTVVDPHTNDAGETTGKKIENGVEHALSPGDIVHVPAGVPHQTIIPPGTLYKAIVIKVKE
jgi:mannose-6-phosphate isomerase-like protein (cupin superfamily)